MVVHLMEGSWVQQLSRYVDWAVAVNPLLFGCWSGEYLQMQEGAYPPPCSLLEMPLSMTGSLEHPELPEAGLC